MMMMFPLVVRERERRRRKLLRKETVTERE